jgi:hypothetical protein
MKLSAQQTAVIISLSEQTARDLAAEFFARVKIDTPVKVIGSARNVTRVRRTIPIIQPGNTAASTRRSIDEKRLTERAVTISDPVELYEDKLHRPS